MDPLMQLRNLRPSAGWFPLVLLVVLGAMPAVAQGQDEGAALEFTPEAVEKTGPPSQNLQQGLALYKAGDYYGASIELQNVIEGKAGDATAHRERAELLMGKALYHLGYYSASLAYFDRLVQKGANHPLAGETLKWLAALSKRIPEVALIDKIGKYDRAQLEAPVLAPVRGELFYMLGRYYYSKQELKRAIDLFAAVTTSSPAFLRAKFMEGITQVRANNRLAAAQAFADILRVARQTPGRADMREFEDLALLSLARVFYGNGKYELSVKYYDKVPSSSPDWLTALFESSWAHFMRNDFSKALGNIHTLNAPFFENQFFPESFVLQAVIYWKNCLYDRSAAAIYDFNRIYLPLKREVDALLERYKDPVELYEWVKGLRAQGQGGLSGDVRRLVLGVLSDKQIETAMRYVEELGREAKQLERADPEWKTSTVAGVVLQELALQKSLAENAAGEIAQRRLERLSAEINELQKQAIKVEYEIINGKQDTLKAALRQEQVTGVAGAKPRDIVPDDEHLFWPFNGEYWRDELGYYRFKIASQCAR